ncbi:Sugar phosphate permease (UhpC) [Fructobacillus cardui]|nr:Sugar phosphate permease (UhpC) [Fructobacillus cardui]
MIQPKRARLHLSLAQKIILINFLGWVFIYADRTILNPVMPEIQRSFGLNHAELGLISSVFLTYTVSQSPFSRLADDHSKKAIVALGFVFFAVMTFLSGIVPTFILFLLARALVGLGQGSFYGPAYGLINENLSDRHATLGMAIINSGQGVGQILGTLLASTLVIQNQDHWSTPFLVIALPTVMVGFLYLYGLPKESRSIRYGGKSVNACGGQ